MNDKYKWFLIAPAIIIILALGFFIHRLVAGGDNSANADQQQNQAVQAQIDNTQQQADGYQDLVTRNPQDTQSLKGLADAYVAIGDLQTEAGKANDASVSYKKAVDTYRQSLAVKDDPDLRIDLAWAYYEMSMYDVAVRELQTSTTQAPANQRAWLTLGYVYANIDQLSKAKDCWTKAQNINPNSAVGQEAKKFLDQSASGSLTPPTRQP